MLKQLNILFPLFSTTIHSTFLLHIQSFQMLLHKNVFDTLLTRECTPKEGEGNTNIGPELRRKIY